jgi:hypothetical protein
MIKTIHVSKDHIRFEKTDWKESWFNNDCPNENLKKILGRESEEIVSVKFDDGDHIGSILNVYFKKQPIPELPIIEEKWIIIDAITNNVYCGKDYDTRAQSPIFTVDAAHLFFPTIFNSEKEAVSELREIIKESPQFVTITKIYKAKHNG